MISLAAIQTAWATRKWLKYVVLGLAVVVLLAGSYVAVTRAFNSIYQAGYQAGVDKTALAYKDAIIEHQNAQLSLQREIVSSTQRYDALYQEFKALQYRSPEEVIKYVRKDPAFAASSRPAESHALRVRELQLLREAAAAH